MCLIIRLLIKFAIILLNFFGTEDFLVFFALKTE